MEHANTRLLPDRDNDHATANRWRRNQFTIDRGNTTAVLDSTPAGTRAYTLAQWQAATTADLPAGRDSAGSGVSATPFAAYRVAGANVVPNTGLIINTAGWTTYSAAAPQPAGSGTVVSAPAADGPGPSP